jgi:hypothetical protein
MGKKNISVGLFVVLGFLAIVPFIGGVLGVFYIIFGLTKFKNTLLVIIGFLGLFLSGVMPLVVRHYSTHRGPFDNSRIKVSKKRMGVLVKEIEFYRLTNGDYPFNLVELKGGRQDIIVLDQIQDVNRELSDKSFFYEKKGSKYYLFSKGFDGIPFTKDDIYPDLFINNGNNIGLIEK